MKLWITTRDDDLTFLARHVRCLSTGPLQQCACGWAGIDWCQHREAALAGWLEAQRRALRARLLSEEGVDRP